VGRVDRPDPLPPGTELAPGWRTTWAGGLVRTARPKQWLKNILVFAAPAAAGVLTHVHAELESVAAFAIFCVVASGVYFLNDALDVGADRMHPRKRLRPIAAGVISIRAGAVIGAALVAAGLALSVAVNAKFLLVVAIYVGVQLAYSLWLKHEPVLDLAAVASGFVLRAIAGGVAVGVPISEWFLIVATFGSFFMAAGKRVADLATLDDAQRSLRPVLTMYSVAYLRSILVLSATVSVTAYCLWAFENVKSVTPGQGHGALWFQLSIAPFTLALMRYALQIDRGHGGAPEDVVLGDRMLLALAVIWAVLFGLGVYR
jgi:decaprenyl-phosphate phosphoribosyltransferase